MHKIEVELRSGTPGSGKTRELFTKDFKKFKGRCLYLGGSHKTLKEHHHRIGGEPYARHIYGLASCCPCLDRDEDEMPRSPLIDTLVKHGFSNKTVCSICKKNKIMEKLEIKECRYHKQFEGIKKCHIVLAPIQCIFSPNLLKKYQPGFVVMDDCLDVINEGLFDIDLWNQLRYLITLANRAGLLPIKLAKEEKKVNPLKTFSERSNLDFVYPQLEKVFQIQLKKLVKQIKNSDSSTYHKTFLIPLELIKDYFEKAKLYGFNRRFSTPAYFYLINYAVEQMKKNKKVRIKLVDAKPPYKILETEKERYRIETGVIVEFVNDGFSNEPINRGSKAFKIGNGRQYFPKESLKQEKVQDSIKEWMELIFKYLNSDPSIKFGVVMHKPKMPKNISESEKLRRLNIRMRLFIPECIKNVVIPPATYWNIRSQNSLEECNVLILLGTPAINKSDMKLLYYDWFPHLPVDDSAFDTKEKEPHGDYYTYPNEHVEMIRKRFEDYELYQAKHRIRPTLSQKLIVMFCLAQKEKLEKDKIKVVNIVAKESFVKMCRRKEQIIDFIRAHGGKVFHGDVEQMLHKQFGVSEKWAYRVILKIIRETEELKYENGWIKYEPKKNC